MTSLDHIAASMGVTQQELRDPGKSDGSDRDLPLKIRRRFVVRAFAEGHDVGPICNFIDRTEVMVLHALRMHCLDMFGGTYGRSVADMADILRRAVA